jgi:type I restriction-modification system DNA methylase subunit
VIANPPFSLEKWGEDLLGIPGQRDRSFRSIVTDDSGRT